MDAKITVTITAELKAKLEHLADERCISIDEMIERLIDDADWNLTN